MVFNGISLKKESPSSSPSPSMTEASSSSIAASSITATKSSSVVGGPMYGSEFVAAKLAVQQIVNLRLMLRYLGVPVAGKTFMFGDNESVVKSGSIPYSKLKKRHNALSYHFVRVAIASGMVDFSHIIPGECNPADILHYCPTEAMTADYMTKPLQGELFKMHKKNIMGTPPN